MNNSKVILVLSKNNINAEYSIKLAKYIKPCIIIYLSDEQGHEPMSAELANYTKLFLHCYNQYDGYSSYKNSIQLPLGYVTSFLNGQSIMDVKHVPVAERDLYVSFVGQLKQDRALMIDTFNNSNINKDKMDFRTPNTKWNVQQLAVPPSELYNLYSNSIFIPVGRGFISLDCFRIYEAIAAGAIPIVVGPNEEILKTFNYNGNIIPMITAESWPEAVNKCEQLLENKDELQNIQTEVIDWFKNRINFIRSRVLEALDSCEILEPAKDIYQSVKKYPNSKWRKGGVYISNLHNCKYSFYSIIIIIVFALIFISLIKKIGITPTHMCYYAKTNPDCESLQYNYKFGLSDLD